MSNPKNYFDSVEYDLYINQSQINILSTHQIESIMYTGNQSQLFKLKNEQSDHPLLIKAICKNQSYKIIFDDLNELSHERLPKILTTYETEKYYYIVKEYISGLSLTNYVQRKTALTEDETKHLLLQLIDVIKYFHDPKRNIVYRDIKPDNIIIDNDGKLYLIDLETIRTYKTEQDSDTVAIVTKGYAAPEQYGYSQTDGRADIYSIGATMYFMLTGKALVTFWLSNREETKNVDLGFNKLSKKWRHIITKCTKFNPDERYENVHKLEKDILSNTKSLLLQKSIIKLAQNKISLLALVLTIFLGISYWKISNEVNQNVGKDKNNYLTFERVLNLTLNKPNEFVKKTADNEEMLSETDERVLITTETESKAIKEVDLVLQHGLKEAYEEKLRNIPIELKDKSYSFRAILSNVQVIETTRVLIQVWDEFGNGNQTGLDSVVFKDGETSIECTSPVKALFLLDEYKYDFIAYIDNAPQNFSLDKGELYSKRLNVSYDGGMVLDIEFYYWEIYNGGSYDD